MQQTNASNTILSLISPFNNTYLTRHHISPYVITILYITYLHLAYTLPQTPTIHSTPPTMKHQRPQGLENDKDEVDIVIEVLEHVDQQPHHFQLLHHIPHFISCHPLCIFISSKFSIAVFKLFF